MKQGSIPFEPANKLERALLASQKGQLPVPEFIEILLASQVMILIDREVGQNGMWDKSAKPMVLIDTAGAPALAIFTAPERSGTWPQRKPKYCFAFLTDFSWILRYMSPKVGIVINPGQSVGLEMPASGVLKLKQENQAR